MGTRRDFLRQGSLWLAAGLITPAALDRLQWTQRRIFALGSSLNRARLTLFGLDGSVLKQIAVPVTYSAGEGMELLVASAEGPTVFQFPGQSVHVRDLLVETPFNFAGEEHMARMRQPVNSFLADGSTLTIQYPPKLATARR